MRLPLLVAGALSGLLAGAAYGAGQFQQSTDAGFDAGTYSTTYRTGSGSAVAVQLDYSGRGAGLGAPGGVAWFDPSWAYRIPVAIQSTNPSALTGYQVPLTLNTQALIAAGRMRADGADIRFTADDGTTPANFYLLSGINTAATVIWVQVPSIAASSSTTVYMYYGNASTTSASNLSGTFVFADDFAAPDGTAPDPARWSSIYTSSNAASLRETRSSLLHYSYGNSLSNGGTSYFGLTSVNSQSYAAGRRYRVTLNASTIGAGQRSSVNLCTQNTDCFSTLGFGGASWIGFTVWHSTPAYTLQRAAGSGIVTLVPNTATTSGAHTVDFLMRPGTYQVTLDGSSIATGPLTTLTPYLQLEAGSSTSTLKDFYFGPVLVTQYSTPEPAQSGVGAEQGAYRSAGTYDSAVLDSGVSGTRYHFANWQSVVPGFTALGFLARAADSSIAAGTWTVVAAGSDPGLSGRYFQYESSFTTSDGRYTASASSVTFAYTSAPPAPASFAGAAVSSTNINWSWSGAGAGQFQPDGFRVYGSTGGLLADLPPAQLSWAETALTPNTSYQTQVQAYNFVGSSSTLLLTQYTLTPPASISPAQSTGTWYGGGTTFTFTNLAGFGGGAVTAYRYSWTASPSYGFLGTEPTWTSGTLSISTPTSGQYYLHALPLNAAGTAGAQFDLGPFLFDTLPPTVTGFTPSSSSWTSAATNVQVDMADAGGSGLASVKFQWLASSGVPAGGWSSADTSVSGSAGSVQRTQFSNGSWYLHILVANTAGTTGYAEAGPYQVDVSSPVGSLAINGGATFTSTSSVTLNLTYADSVSGIAGVRYRNVPGAFTAYEAPASTRAWDLAGGVGVSTVEYQLIDQASNTVTYQASIFYSRQTGLSLPNATVFATGETPAQTSTATPTATLSFTPSGSGIAGRSVSFQLLSASGAATTDALGAASFAFAAPTSSGVYMASAAFNGDSAYDASAATAALTVLPRNSFLVTPAGSATTGSSVTVTVTLIDLATTVGLSSKTVSISFQGSTIAATTDGSGSASAVFVAPSSSGTFSYSGSYAGGAVYGPVGASGSITVGRRGTLVIGSPGTASVNQAFTVTATLFDLVSATRLQGKTIVFQLGGSTGSAITDATGIATTTFVSASTGAFNCVATFQGDSGYGVNSDTNVITVNLRGTNVAAVSVSTTVGSPFFLQATATDAGGGGPLVGSTMTFTFQGSTAALTTDASGFAQAAFTAPAASGTYSFVAVSTGGTFNSPGTGNGTVTVTRRVSVVAVPAVAAGAASLFTATATLTDFNDGTPLAGATVYFQFQGSSAAATTDASGSAFASFTAPGSVGSYSLSSTFLGDATYLPTSSTGTMTVNTRATTLAALNVTVPASGVFTASATLTETVGSAPIGGKAVIFVFQGTAHNGTTDGSGIASAVFTAPAATGTFSLNADFAGDSLYLASSDTKTVTSSLRPLTVTPAAAAVTASDVFTATATVTDGLSGNPAAGLQMLLTFQGVTSTVTTSAAGVATATFTAPSSTGSYTWQASYPGDATYASAANSAAVAVSPRASAIAPLTVTVVANRVFTASATLTDAETGAPFSGKTVSFSFQGSTLTSVTNGAGLATRTFLAPASTATLSYMAWFSGDATAASSTGTAAVTIIKLPSSLAGLDVQTSASSSFNTQETLTDAGSGAPIAGENVVFTYSGSSQTVATNSNGVAIATFTAASTSTLSNFTATFAGNATYAGTSDSRVVAVGFRYTASIPFNTSGLALDASTFTVKLIDLQTVSPLSGRSMDLNIQSTTHTAVTDVNGLAISTFTLPSSSGVYALNGSFGGESFYVASAGTATITVLSRPNLMFGGLAQNNLDRLATMGALTGSWSLTDSNNFLGIPGRSVEVDFLGSTYTVTTNASGNFTLNSLGLQTSTITSSNPMSFIFQGDPTYSSSTLNFTVNVVPRYAWLTAGGPTANAGLSFNVNGTLTNSGDGVGIATRTVTFTFNGSTTSAVTDASGFAVASFVAPNSTGTFPLTSHFAGDDTYSSAGGSGVVTVINRQSLLSNGGWACGVGLPCGIGSNLSDLVNATAISGATITYTVSGTTYTAVTDASGNTSLTLPPFPTTGGRTVYANFPGNGAFLPTTSTTTLPINLRPTLMGVSDLNVQRLDLFQLAAGLQEFFYVASPTAIAGATVTFQFNGSTYTALTNSFGTAFASVTAPSGLGTYPFTASFAADSTFTAVSNSANIIVGKRDTQLSATNLNPSFSQSFWATAQLQDGSNPISGATITFTLQGATQTAITTALGVASAPFVAPASTGSYILGVAYAGDALYNASTATASILVDRRLTSLGADNLTSAVLSSFTARATLTDGVSGGPRSGQTIIFSYQGSSATALTDGAGVATATFVAPSTSAASYSATYLGDTLYYASSSTGALTLSLRSTTLIAFDQFPAVSQGFSATAQLKDFETGAAISGSTLTFTFQGSTKTAPTNGAGQASAAFTAPAATGTYAYTAFFAGNSVYQPSTGTANAVTSQRTTNLTPSAVNAAENSVFTVQATFVDSVSGLPVAGATVTFVFQGSTTTAVTDASGVAASTYTAPASSGTYSYSANFPGNGTYTAAATGASVTVGLRQTSLIVSNVSVLIGNGWTASGTLIDSASGLPISGRSVSLLFGASTQTAPTSALGVSTESFPSQSQQGTQAIYGSFAGDSTYSAASGSGVLTVSSRTTGVVLTLPNAYPGEVFRATATLTDSYSGSPISSFTVLFAFAPSSAAATTNGSGAAPADFPSPASTGTFSLSATFVSSGPYVTSSATGTLTVLQRPTSLAVGNAGVVLYSSFTASASLTDTRLSSGVSAGSVSFVFNGATQTVLTNGLGSATTTFAAPTTAGSYALTASYPGSSILQAAAGSANVNVTLRPTLTVGSPQTTTANSLFSVSAQLKDANTSVSLSGLSMVFQFNGSSQAATTNGSGQAVASFAAPASSGAYAFAVTYQGGSVYAVSSDSEPVTVGQRVVSVALPDYNSNALSPFSPVATVIDAGSGQPIVGRAVTFVFQNSTETAATNGLGSATTNYVSPAGIGSYPLTAATAGDATYAVGYASATVSIQSFSSTITVSNASSFVSQVFIASATVLRSYDSAPLVGSSVVFQLQGQGAVLVATTNAVGLATAAFTAAASSGPYFISATYGGDAVYLGGSSTGTLTVSPLATTLASGLVKTVNALDVVTATATLTKTVAGTPINAKVIHFSFQGSNKNATTNAGGVATTTFTAVSSGTWNYAATFNGDSGFGSSSTGTAITVVPLNTAMAASPVTAKTLDLFTASATLTAAGQPVVGRSVIFYYLGVSSAAPTNGAGLATVVYSAGISSGTPQFSATFLADATYNAQSATATVTLSPRPTALASPAATVYANEFLVTSATLTDTTDGSSVTGQPVAFSYAGASSTTLTGATGAANARFTAGSSSGTFAYYSTFTANATYLGSVAGAGAVTVLPRPTALATQAVTVGVGLNFISTATLTDVRLGSNLSGQTVVFNYMSSSYTAVTNSLGIATAAFTAPGGPVVNSFSATLSSGPTYAGVSSTATVNVVTRATNLTASAVPSVSANTVFTATATMTDPAAGDGPIAGRTVTFLYLGTSSASVTNASGQATVTYNAGASSGTYSYSATFAGDGTYSFNSDTATVAVAPRATSMAALAVGPIYTLSVYTASATLTDVALGAPIQGQSLAFLYQGTSSSSLTNSSGLGTVQFNAGTASGTWSYSATLAAGPTYLGSSSTGTVTLNPRPTVLTAQTTTALTLNTFIASATLVDGLNSNPISGQLVWFRYGSNWQSATTNGSGIASHVYSVGSASGTYSYSATFQPTPTYLGQSSTGTLTASPRTTTLGSAAIPAVFTNTVFAASATLNDLATGAAVSGKTISFNYNGVVQTAVTGALGSATTNYAAGPSSGPYQYSATFAADSTYTGQSSTSAVTVNARTTSIAASAATSIVNGVFTASGTLTDLVGSTILPGQTLVFQYRSSSGSAVTNGSGLATVNFNAGVSSGSYSFAVTLASGPTYAGTSSTAAVSVLTRPTVLAGSAVASVPAADLFTATATLTDQGTGAPIAGRTVVFLYKGSSSSSSVTNASGLATVTYNAGVSSGAYSFSATFAGDAAYSAQSATATVTVTARPTAMAAVAVPGAYANEVITASSTLTDVELGSGLSGQSVRFAYHTGASSASATNAAGLGTVTYPAGSTGTFTFSATLPANAEYAFSSSSASVTVLPRPTSVAAAAVASVNASDVFTASATVTDLRLSAPLNGVTIWFFYNGSWLSATSSGAGLAARTFNAGSSSGTYSFSATLSSGSVYAGQSSTATVVVVPRASALISAPVASVPALGVFQASATLTDGPTGLPVSGKTISFNYNGAVQTAVTGALGSATTNYAAGPSSGTYQYSATFQADATYLASSSTSSVVVAPRPTLAAASAASVQASSVFTASATLTDVLLSGPIAGQTMWFNFGGASSSSLTNASGLATVTYTAPVSSGPYQFSVTFSSGPTYAGQSSTATVTVLQRTTALSSNAVPQVYANAVFTATATLTDQATSGPLSGKSVTFLYLGVSSASLTNASGQATVTYGAGASSGTLSYSATFAGDASYAFKSSTASVVVAPKPTSTTVYGVASVYANSVFTATAVVSDLIAGGGVSGQTVSFSYLGSVQAAATAASGQATKTYNAGLSSGTYSYSATLSSGPTYGFSSATAAVTVISRPIVVNALVNAAYVGTVFVASATLTDGLSSSLVSGRPVTFLYLGVSSTSLTNASGLATVSYSAGGSSGTPSFSATYVADALYSAASATATVTVSPRPTNLSALPVGSTPAIDPFSAAATLTDGLGAGPVSGQSIWFAYQGSVSSAATNGSGTASVSFSAGASSGTYSFSATLSSGAAYAGTSSTATVTVASRATALSVPAFPSVRTLGVFIASATLKDSSSSNPIAGQTISFLFNGSTVTGVSDAAGLSTASFAVPASSGTYGVWASLAANGTYLASSASGTVAASSRLTDLVAHGVTAYALEAFLSSATLTDQATSGAISGRSVSFLFQATFASGTTNGSGAATGGYGAPASSGAYSYTASFAGDATYGAVSSTAASVTVLARPTGLAAVAPASVFANAVFAATATLTDVRASGPAAGRSVVLSYRSQSRPVVTDAAGVAVATFTAEASTGAFVLSASWAGDALYLSSATTASTTTVLPRPTALAAAAANAYALGVFTATATLTDTISTTGVAGRAVVFAYLASSGAATTDASGVATALFAAGSSTGALSYSATFAADGTYAGASSTGAVTVNPRPTSILGVDATVYASAVFTASAAVTDVVSGASLAGKTVSFVFSGSTRTAVTDAFGVAGSTFSAPASSGAYALSVSVSTDSIYVGSASAATITVARRPSATAVAGVAVNANDLFTATATVTDTLDSSGVSGRTVSFVFQGSTQTGTTDGLGQATTTFFAPNLAGGFTLAASFGGDSLHSASSGTATVAVSARSSSATVQAVSVLAMDLFTATATITDTALGTPIGGASVSFNFLTTTSPVTADGAGVAASTFTAPASTGTYSYRATYAGSSTYLSTSSLALVTVTARATAIAVSSGVADVLAPYIATATLRDVATGTGIAGRSLAFVLNGTTVAATTDGTGTAHASFTAPSPAGDYALQTTFTADSTYAGSVSTATVTTVTRPVRLSTQTASAAALDPLTLTITLTDLGAGTPLNGRTLTFVLTGATQTAVTDALGAGTTGYTAPAASGTYVFTATFAGDANYSSGTVTAAAAVLARPTNMTAQSFTTIAGTVFAATATLRDTESNGVLAGRAVHMHFSDGAAGQDADVTTDGFGNAVTSFTAPSGTGLFDYTATFAGDQTYGVSVDTGHVQIGLASTMIAGDISTVELDTFTFSAKLIDPFAVPITSKTVTFTFAGSTHTVTTDLTGFARSTFTAPASSGVYAGAASFAGDSTYAPSQANININVAQRGTTMSAAAASVFVGSTVTVTARVRDNGTTLGVSSKTVVFTLFGSTVSAQTDASGVATGVFPPAPSSGSFAIAAAFAGDGIYAPSTDVSTATVSLILTLPLPLPASASPSTQVSLAGKLLSLLAGTGIPGETVQFQFGASTASAVTDANGQAAVQFTAPASSGTYSFTTLFAGNTTYASSASTGTLSVGVRATTLALTAPAAYANTVVYASATLTDTINATGVSTETIVFTFNAATASAATDGFGVAVASFAAPSSTGTFALSAAFAGGATYAASTAAAVVPINARPVTAVVPPVTIPVGTVFVATGTFTDTLAGVPLPGSAVVFQFSGSSAAATTDALGVATASFTAPLSSGAYSVGASYAGNSIEAAASSTATVTVIQLGSLITGAPVATFADASFTAAFTLIAQADGTPLTGRALSVVFAGSTATVVTNGSGVASATFTAPGVLGVYAASATFAGDVSYASTLAQADVTVSSRPTSMTMTPVNASALAVFVATITMVDVPNGLPLAAAPVSFFFQGSTSTAITDASGVALATFSAPGSTGSYALNGLFSGTTIYLSTSAFTTVVISSGSGSGGTGGSGGGQGTVMAGFDLSVIVSRVFIASATLTLTAGGAPVAGKNVDFLLAGTTVTGVTNAVGLATATFTAPATSGTVIMTESFAGDATFDYAAATSAVTVLPEPTVIVMPDVLTSSGSIFVATATLSVAASSAPLAARSIAFQFQGTTVAATTNASGTAFATFLAPTSSGSFALSAAYAGDPVYALTSTTASVVVQAAGGGGGATGGSGGGAPALVQFASPVTPAVSSQVFTAKATLYDPNLAQGIAGRTLAFVFQNSTSTAVTDAFGLAQATFTAPGVYGPYVLSSYFIGDSTYVAASATNTVIVGLGETPADPQNVAVTTQTATQIVIGWNPVYYSVNGVFMSSEVVRYAIERSTDIAAGWSSYTSVSSAAATTLTLSTVTADTWFRVVAVSREGYRSPGLAALRVSPFVTASRVFLSEDQAAWVEVGSDADKDLSKGGVNRLIALTTVSAPGYVFAYSVRVFDGSSYSDDFVFNNSYTGIKLVVSIDRARASALGAAGLSTAGLKPLDANQLALFFWNGVEWVKLGGVESVSNGQASITLRRTGQFAAGFAPLAGSFSLTKVAPRVFQPGATKCTSGNLADCDRARFYFEDPQNSEVNIRIFDISGATVRSTVARENSNTLYWDGADDSGKFVKAGVYIYQIETGGQAKTGTIAVVR